MKIADTKPREDAVHYLSESIEPIPNTYISWSFIVYIYNVYIL